MCRSKAQGGRRCPGKSKPRKTTQTPTLLNASPARATQILNPTPKAQNSPKPSTPTFDQLKSTPTDEWFNAPWKERKTIVERALNEVINATGSTAKFDGWNRRTTSSGLATYGYNAYTGEERRTIELSDTVNRHSEPINLADTIAHEVAHTLAPHHAGHGQEWVKQFSEVKQLVGLNTEFSMVHKQTQAEVASKVKEMVAKAANAPWIGSCPQGHTFPAGRKPKHSYNCVKCSREGKPAVISYERNTNSERRAA
jgi:predicted SprT family Zn-dependent metalloprotease